MLFKKVLKKCSRGFTLIELLVVISIIALLLAILMPALGKAKELAKALVCSTRLKDIGLSMNFYVDDHDGKLPSNHPNLEDIGSVSITDFRWCTRLAPYYDRKGGAGSTMQEDNAYDFELFRCPTQDYIAKKLIDGTSLL